jgi:hypothetical protein
LDEGHRPSFAAASHPAWVADKRRPAIGGIGLLPMPAVVGHPLPGALAVLLRVLPRGVVLVFGGLQIMAEGNPGMMRRLLMTARLVMLGGFTMMFGGLLVMLGGVFVMLVNLMLCHVRLPDVCWLHERVPSPRSRFPVLVSVLRFRQMAGVIV